MKLTKQIRLFYKQGNSDKVYEVDLCEVGSCLYIVNFRYGRRGKALREGTKTDSPVELAKAEKIYDDLVKSKTKKGYQTTLPTDEEPTLSTPPKHVDKSARENAIIQRLQEEQTSDWSLERIIWRVGELRMISAIPAVLDYVGRSVLCDYCIAWAIGRCKSLEGMPVLEKFCKGEFDYKITPESNNVRRIALFATLDVVDDNNKKQIINNLRNELPTEINIALDSKSHEKIFYELSKFLNDNDYRKFEIIDTLYAINFDPIRLALYDYLASVELKPNIFQVIRHVYKMSEFRDDAKFWSMLTHRFETKKAMYRSPEYMYGNSFSLDMGNYNYKSFKLDDLKKPNAELAYSSKTRNYLKKRSWRYLKQNGLEGNKQYTDLAKELLLLVTDSDGIQPAEYQYYKYDASWNYEVISTWRDRYAYFISLNHILYSNSPRYYLPPNSKSWVCKKPYTPGGPVPAEREEAFPYLWDQNPEALLELLQKSKCCEIHHFAVKAIKANNKFLLELDRLVLFSLLHAEYDVTAQFVFDFIKSNIPKDEWSDELLLALLESSLEDAQKEVCKFINERSLEYIDNSTVLAAMITSNYPDVRKSLKQLLATARVKDDVFVVLIGKLMPTLQDIAKAGNANLADIIQFCIKNLSGYFKLVEMSAIVSLIDSSSLELQAFGAAILASHQLNADQIPDELLNKLLESEDDNIRVLAVQLLSQFNDQDLLQRSELLVSLFVQKQESLRAEITPVITRLATSDSGFAVSICDQFLKILIRGRAGDNVLNAISDILITDLKFITDQIDTAKVLKLLKVNISAAQRVGEQQIQRFNENDFELGDIVSLANHRLVDVRTHALSMFKADQQRLKDDMMTAVKILDVQWDDIQKDVFDYFREVFNKDDFSVEALTLICDSVYEPTQRYGRELLMEHFQQEDGVDYLLNLSEHPSINMQLFVSSFLFNYAGDSVERFQELVPFCHRCLMQVNRGRTVKKRVIAFLKQQVIQSKEMAAAVLSLLELLSSSISVETKAACVDIIIEIKQQYPDVETGLKVVEPEVRHAV